MCVYVCVCVCVCVCVYMKSDCQFKTALKLELSKKDLPQQANQNEYSKRQQLIVINKRLHAKIITTILCTVCQSSWNKGDY